MTADQLTELQQQLRAARIAVDKNTYLPITFRQEFDAYKKEQADARDVVRREVEAAKVVANKYVDDKLSNINAGSLIAEVTRLLSFRP